MPIQTTDIGRVWKPTPRQEEFLSLPDTIFEGMFGGAAGGGKSEALMMLPICRGFIQHPRFKGILFRRTYPELEKELILRSHNFYLDAGGKYNDQKKRWSFPSGAVIQFGYAEHEPDVRKYDTTEYNYMGFDEVTSFTEFMYMYLAFTRVRSSDGNLPAIVRSGTNPGNIGHAFFKRRFVDPCINGGVILKETRELDGERRDFLRIFIKSLVQDNEHIIKNDPTYQYRMSMLPEAEKAAKLYGDWSVFEGQVFEDFRDGGDRTKFSDEPANACHVIEPFKIPHYWPRILSIDWGYAANNVCGFYAINPYPSAERPAQIYKYRELVRNRTKVSVWAKELKEVIQANSEEFIDFVLDPSAWQNRGDEFTLSEQITAELQDVKLSPRKADNDRVGGKILIQELLRWKPRISNLTPIKYSSEIAAEISRKQGPKGLESYLEACQPQKLDQFLPKFQIFSSCIETIRVLPLCIYDKKNPEDIQEFTGDDAYDETRYGLKASQHYLDHGKIEFAKEAKLADIEARLERTGNYTEYYIRAAGLGSSAAKSNKMQGYRMRRRRVGH